MLLFVFNSPPRHTLVDLPAFIQFLCKNILQLLCNLFWFSFASNSLYIYLRSSNKIFVMILMRVQGQLIFHILFSNNVWGHVTGAPQSFSASISAPQCVTQNKFIYLQNAKICSHSSQNYCCVILSWALMFMFCTKYIGSDKLSERARPFVYLYFIIIISSSAAAAAALNCALIYHFYV